MLEFGIALVIILLNTHDVPISPVDSVTASENTLSVTSDVMVNLWPVDIRLLYCSFRGH